MFLSKNTNQQKSVKSVENKLWVKLGQLVMNL